MLPSDAINGSVLNIEVACCLQTKLGELLLHCKIQFSFSYMIPLRTVCNAIVHLNLMCTDRIHFYVMVLIIRALFLEHFEKSLKHFENLLLLTVNAGH